MLPGAGLAAEDPALAFAGLFRWLWGSRAPALGCRGAAGRGGF